MPLVGARPQREPVAADRDLGKSRVVEQPVQRARGKPGLVRHVQIAMRERGGMPEDHVERRDRSARRQIRLILEFAGPEAEIRFATPAGLHRGRVVGGRSEVALPDCPAPKAAPDVRTLPGENSPTLVRPSVPHLVLTVDDVETVAVAVRGPVLRSDPATGDGGANVNWVSPKGDGSWKMRTFERGVEGETLACGTGAVASALTLAGRALVKSPARIWTRSGLPLDVSFDFGTSTASSIRLAGEGRLVYRGLTGSLPTDCPNDT